MKLRIIVSVWAALLAATVNYAQNASLSASASAMPAGGVLTVTAAANYSGTPSAVGWSVTLPEGWSYVATGGPDVPQVGPQQGATGTIEWAYSSVPANAARFTFTVKAAGKPGSVQVPAKVFLRVDGKQQTVEVAPASVSVVR